MATAASTSTAADSDNYILYDVFINYREPDVNQTLFAGQTFFAGHLFRRLISVGLRVFLGYKVIEEGEDLKRQTQGAIKTASVHVAIFTPKYAESKLCLDELVLMLESEAPIIPVFHNVKPADLRWTQGGEGVYARYLLNLEKKRTHDSQPRYSSQTIENWRNALSRVADISGFDLDRFNGDEGELIEEVVRSVLNKTKVRGSAAARYRVGLDEKVKDFENKVLLENHQSAKPRVGLDEKVKDFENKVLLENYQSAKPRVGLDEKVKDFENKVLLENHQSAKPQLVGIVGLGGVGKTTLAKELFDRKRVDYSKFCFLSNVRENARKGFLNSLQRQLLKSLTGTDVLINSIDEGIAELKKHLTSYPVFVILDDVDQLNQIDALLPVRADLLSDSLVLITSRDDKVIKSSGVENASIYQLTGLNDQHSLELFCAYAFSQPHPLSGFESLVDNFLKVCDGLPLFLKVFGALLFGKYDKSDWKDPLDKLQQVLLSDTQEKLQISYQSLEMEQQQMFLDSACFFIGQKRDTAIRTWDGSGWKGWLGFRTLENRCLLEVDSENNIDMHDHLRDFGKAVADASLPRRLLHSTAIENMLEQLSNGPVPSVRGIRMVPGEYNDEVDASGGIDTRTLELVDALNGIDMRTLELVDTENVILERILKKPMHVPSLIWLRWNKCPNLSLPSWIPMKSLRVLQVSGSELKTLWEDKSQVPLQLRELEINAPLSNIPKSIGLLEHLERIVVARFLSGHVHLTKLPEEFCHLRSLRSLVLTECSKMKSLPDSFGHLGNLQHIDLSFCCNLERLPDLGSLPDLVRLPYSRLQDSIRLQHINLSYCHDLERLPDSIGGLLSLQHIDLRGCHNLESLPDSFGELWDLRHINLSGCHDLQRLPDSFVNLRYLQHIDLQGCHNLQSLPDGFGDLMNLEHVNLSNCHDLEWLPDSFGNLRNLQYIDLSGCHNLERLPNYFRNFNKLKYLDVEGCSNLIIETIEITDNLPEAHQRQLEQLYLSDA